MLTHNIFDHEQGQHGFNPPYVSWKLETKQINDKSYQSVFLRQRKLPDSQPLDSIIQNSVKCLNENLASQLYLKNFRIQPHTQTRPHKCIILEDHIATHPHKRVQSF